MEKLTRTRWVTLNGSPVKVSELPDKYKQALGNRVRTEPIRRLGFEIEMGGRWIMSDGEPKLPRKDVLDTS